MPPSAIIGPNTPRAKDPLVRSSTRVGRPAATGLVVLSAAAAAAVYAATSAGRPELPLLAAMAGVVLAGALHRPAIGLVLLVVAAYTNAAAVAETRHGISLFNELLVPLLAALAAVRLIVHGERARDLPLMLALFAVYVGSVALSLFYAREPAIAEEKLLGLVKDAVIGLVVIALLTTFDRFRAVCISLLAAAVVLASLGVWQAASGRYDQDFGGFALATVQHVAGDVDTFRISGPLSDANYFAQILLLALPIGIDRMLHARGGAGRLMGAFAAIVVGVALLLTYSRGGLLGAMVVLAVMTWQSGRRLVPIAAVLLVVAAAAVPLIPAEYGARVASIADGVRAALGEGGGGGDEAISGRLSEMAAAAHLFVENPLLGIGYGQFEHRYQDTAMIHGLMARGADREAHSLYLQVLAERGIVGGVFFLALIMLALRSAAVASRRLLAAARTEEAGLARAWLAGLAGFLVAAVFLHDGYPRYFWIAVAVALSLPQASAIISHGSGARPAGTPPDPGAEERG